MRAIFVAAVLAATVGCGPAVPGTEQPSAGRDTTNGAAADSASVAVELRTDRTRYVPGDAVSVTLVNHSSDTYTFNPCTRTLERETSGGWTSISEPQRVCTMQAYILEPRQTRTETTELPDTLAPGRYRMVISLTREGVAAGSEPVRAVSGVLSVGQ